MQNISIRKGRPEDAYHFSELVMLTAPEYLENILGERVKYILERLFMHPGNIFSFRHSYFMEIDGEIAGMTLFYGYDEKNKGIVPFVLLLIKHLKIKFLSRILPLLKFGSIFARTKRGDIYSSSSALYPRFRSHGLGEKLFGIAEEDARKAGLKRIVVDVNVDNHRAVKLREKLGYKVEARLAAFKIKDKVFEYFRLVKYI